MILFFNFQVGSDKPLSLVDAVVKTESNAPHVSALAKALERPLADSKVMNGSSMYQASFQQSFQKMTTLTGSTVHAQPGLTPLLATTSAPMLANGKCAIRHNNYSIKYRMPKCCTVLMCKVFNHI